MPKFILIAIIVLAMLFVAADGGEKTAEKPGKTAKKGLAKLKLHLPKPLIIGTREPIPGIPNLEKLRPKDWKRPAFYVPAGTTNLAKSKKVTSSDDLPIIGEPKMITDGNKKGTDDTLVEFAPGKQWAQIDLGKKSTIYAVVVWHNHGRLVAYKDVVVKVADDKDMITNCRTVYNSDHDNSSKLGVGKDLAYRESFGGRIINAKGVRGRYVRLYSNGNSSNDMNHYVEVEVYGKP